MKMVRAARRSSFTGLPPAVGSSGAIFTIVSTLSSPTLRPASVCGTPQPYDPVPWFWSDQYDLKLQMAGLSDGYDDASIVGDVTGKRFSVEYRRAGRLIAVDAVNDARAHMLSRRRIAEET